MLIEQGGDERAGYEVHVDTSKRILFTRSWGLWDLPLAERYRAVMGSASEKLRGAPWSVLSDRRKMVPQREEVLAVMTEVMNRANVTGRRRAAVIVASPIAQLQMKRLANEAHVDQRQFADEASALAWLDTPLPPKSKKTRI